MMTTTIVFTILVITSITCPVALSFTAFLSRQRRYVLNHQNKDRPSRQVLHRDDRRRCVSAAERHTNAGISETRRENICCISTVPSLVSRASELGERLQVPVFETTESFSSLPTSSCTHALVVSPYEEAGVSSYSIGLEELPNLKPSKKLKLNKLRPLVIDFLPSQSSRMGKRASTKRGGSELLIKAIGSSSPSSIVFDMTAGFGHDSLIMATRQRTVCMMERDPIVATLLEDAMRRLKLIASARRPDDETIPSEKTKIRIAQGLEQQLSLEVGNSVDILAGLGVHVSNSSCPRPNVCYLDPMFPARAKSAAVKKNMQLLHGLLSSQDETSLEASLEEELKLLEAAYEAATDRVVVKRPIHAAPLGGEMSNLKVSYDVRGSINRWDVYVKPCKSEGTIDPVESVKSRGV